MHSLVRALVLEKLAERRAAAERLAKAAALLVDGSVECHSGCEVYLRGALAAYREVDK